MAVTQDQLRLRMRALVDPMCGELEHEADAIIAGTADRDVQLAALAWEIEAVPALREALYEPDPLTAGIDTLALCNQMSDYFETGAGKASLGSASAPAAADTCRRLADRLSKALASATVSGDIPKVRAFAKKWATAHPIQHSIAERESVVAGLTEFETAGGLTAGQTIAELSTTLDDLNRKLEVYSSQLFRQARWEAQRMKLQWVSELRVDQAIPLAERAVDVAEHAGRTVDQLSPALERTLAVAEATPKLVATEREAAINAVHEEMSQTLQFVHDERVAALQQLGKERGMALAELTEMVVAQRKQIVVEADQLTGNRIDYTVRQVTRLVLIAVAAALLMSLVGVLLLRWLPARAEGRRLMACS
jgi:hypothetical protein